MMSSLQLSAVSLQFFDQAEQHSCNFVCRFEQRSSIVLRKIVKSSRKNQKGFDLPGRTKADSQTASKVWVCSPSMSLCNVRGNRGTGSAQLRREAELFITRKSGSKAVNRDTKVHTLLPHVKILIARRSHCHDPSTTLPAEGRRQVA